MADRGKRAEAGRGVRDESGLTPAQQTWAAHIRQAEAEGLSFKAYCGREGLSVGGLYAARKALRANDLGVAEPPPRFAAVRVAQGSEPRAAYVLLPNGVQLSVSVSGVDELVHLAQGLGQLAR